MGGLFGWLGEAVNSVTSPLMGVELFGGGTLGDNTADAMTKEARTAADKQKEGWDWLADYGKQMLQMPTAGGKQTIGGTTSAAGQTGQTGTGAQAQAGQGATLADVAGRYLSNLDLITSGGDRMGYALNPNQQKFLNQTLGTVNVQRAKAVDSARRALADRGITSGPLYDATLRRLADHYDQQVMSTSTQYAEQARTQRLQEGYQYLQQLMAQIGQGTGLVGQGLSGGQNYTNYLQQSAAAKHAEGAAAEKRFSDFLGLLASGGMSGTGKPWSIGGFGGKAPVPAQTTGGIVPGQGVGPYQMSLGYNPDLTWRGGL